ncbi:MULTISPECIES: phosphoadenosine phosphosulfate reductase family protein [Piscinibacter]|uniref:phosphoadenosine phosphosulfate reductase domain-containing protein n=1 Tax=Piscinibacter TaxID=1114981 RepID=UPI000FDD6F62|nr:phosphoadenosine phosphosulfate reductase family protein [Piscinibacter defluvii]
MQQLIDLRHETPEAIALEAIRSFMSDGHPAVVFYSGGKDSSVLLNLTLTAASDQVKAGRQPLVVIAHSDVGVENPEIQRLVSGEIRKAARFAKAHGVTAIVRVAQPAFWDTYPVRVIGGRALPTFPDSRRDCQTDLKRLPNERELALIERELQAKGWNKPVLMTGVRRDESMVRASNVRGRGEQAVSLWTDKEGRLRLTPVLDWTVDDVWQYLGLANAGVIPAYSTFEETMQTYQAAGGSSCVVVADAEMQKHSKPCSSRFGCWACTAVREDKSLRQMIETDPGRYGYMEPLAALRDFIAFTQYDWSRRQFVGRSIVDGFIEVGADTYSPAMLAELLRYTLSAQKLSGVPIVSAAQLIAIDARWSQYAIAAPFSALRIWKEVEDGAIWTPPKLRPFPKTEVPKLGKIFVGGWNDDVTSELEVTGLRNPAWEDFAETCGPGLRTLASGRAVVDVEGESEIDEEAAWLFLDFELERMLGNRPMLSGYWTAGYETYLSFGIVRPAKGQSARVDEILRRSQWRQRHDLHGQRSADELAARLTVRYPRQADLFDLAAA